MVPNSRASGAEILGGGFAMGRAWRRGTHPPLRPPFFFFKTYCMLPLMEAHVHWFTDQCRQNSLFYEGIRVLEFQDRDFRSVYKKRVRYTRRAYSWCPGSRAPYKDHIQFRGVWKYSPVLQEGNMHIMAAG